MTRRSSVLVLLLILASWAPGCLGQFSFQQQNSPLRGQGVPSANVTSPTISIFLDRLLGLDEQQYRFDAVLYAYVTWIDEVGVEQWFYNNIASNCADPSRNDYDQDWCDGFRAVCERFDNASAGSAEMAQTRAAGAYYLGAPIDLPCRTWKSDGTPARTECNRYCSNGYNAGDCCDGIFIPDVTMRNIYSLDQDFVGETQLTPQYDYRKEKYGSWQWVVQFHAIFFIRMDFRAFPWDSQQLLIQMTYTHDPEDSNTTSVLLPSSAGVLSLRPRRNGDDSSGWRVDDVYLEPYVIQRPEGLVRGSISPPHVDDPVPLFSTATEPDGERHVTGLEPVFQRRLNPGNTILVVIKVSRYSSFYVVNNLVPIILSTALGFFVFLLDSDDMEKRLGLLVTLFLALTALQFVISGNLPASSYVLKTQALVLAGYAFFMAMALESWLVYVLGSSHARHERMRAWRRAYKQYINGSISAEALADAAAGADVQAPPSVRHCAPRIPSLPPASRSTRSDGGSGGEGDVEDGPSPALAHLAGDGSSGRHETTTCDEGKGRRPPSMLKRLGGKRFNRALMPLKHDADYAGWLAQRVDFWSLIFFVAAYFIVAACILAT